MTKRNIILLAIVLVLACAEGTFVYWLYNAPVEEVSLKLTAKDWFKKVPADEPTVEQNQDNPAPQGLSSEEAKNLKEAMTSAPGQIKFCLKEKITEERFEQIVSSEILPNQEDKQAMDDCVAAFFSSIKQEDEE